ncbi:MAG: GerAB/ArcD/ProY family transporter [Solirubrobacterales bacterium]
MNMIPQGKISGAQLTALLIFCRLEPVTLLCPTVTLVKQTPVAWTNDLLGGLVSCVLVFFIVKLSLKFPDQTIVEYLPVLFGKVLGNTASAVFLLAAIIITAITARTFAETVGITMLPTTPILVSFFLPLLLEANVLRGGLEVLARLAGFIVVPFILGLLCIAVLPYDMVQFGYLQPFYFPDGWFDLIPPTASVISYFTEFIIIGMVIPYLDRPQDAVRYSLLAVLITSSMMVLQCVALTSVFGPLVPHLTLPAYSLSRVISVGGFFEGFEVVLTMFFLFGAGIKGAFFLWAAAEGLSQLLGLRSSKQLVYPLAVIAGALGVWFFSGTIDLVNFLRKPFAIFCLVGIITYLLTAYAAARLIQPNSARRGEAQSDG